MRFIADTMLGRLATWLRIVGCDVVYEREIEDTEVLRRARDEGRVLLTRDRRLIRRADVPALLIESDQYLSQMRQVLEAFSIDPDAAWFSRCLRCNTLLEEVDRSAARDRVPPYVFATQPQFWRCPTCDRLYWPGTHAEHARAALEGLRRRP